MSRCCMARRSVFMKWLFLLSVIYVITVILLLKVCSPSQPVSCPTGDESINNLNQLGGKSVAQVSINQKSDDDGSTENLFSKLMDRGDNPEWGKHKLAVIVPYRDRLEELLEFAPYINSYLIKKKVRHKIYVINQVDSLRFNRGSLINIGVKESSVSCDYIAMHDVDLLPVNDKLDYSYPAVGPYHIASPEFHPLYHYHSFIGGILLISRNHFMSVNGMSNRYYGWGREDDEFYVRLKKAGLLDFKWIEKNGMKEPFYSIRRPSNLTITTGNKTFIHIHDKIKRPRDNIRVFDQTKKTSRLDKETGVNTVSYEVIQRHRLIMNGAPVTMLEVKILCDLIKTPWCLKKVDHYLLTNTFNRTQ